MTASRPPVVTWRVASGPAGVRCRQLVRVFRNAYVEVAAATSPVTVLAAASHSVGPRAVLSHLSAAQALGLPMPPGNDGTRPVHVTVASQPRPRHQPRLRVHVRGLGQSEVGRCQGLRVASPARTWADLARELSLHDLVAMADGILRAGWASVDELRAGLPGRRSAPVAHAALELCDGRSESYWESYLRVNLHRAGIPVVPQHVVWDASGAFVARVDLALPSARIAIEYDGAHHLEPRQRRADLRRVHAMERAGWLVVRLTAEEVVGESKPAIAEVRRAQSTRAQAAEKMT